MGAPRYNQEAKDKALAALMASATEADGEWVPNYLSVSGQLKIPRTTLKRWWNGRERSLDSQLRSSCTRARDEVRKEGAETWTRARLEDLRGGIEWLLKEEHRTKQLYQAPSGNMIEGYPVRPDHLAKTYSLAFSMLKEIDSVLSGEGGNKQVRISRMRDHVKRVRSSYKPSQKKK